MSKVGKMPNNGIAKKIGAAVPFTVYLPSDFRTNGELLAASREYRTVAAEAVARRAVKLTE